MLSKKLEFDLHYNRQSAAKQTKAAIEARPRAIAGDLKSEVDNTSQ
jgi:hypothetical protein